MYKYTSYLILISIMIGIMGFVIKNSNACDTNSQLITIWERRTDLQKAFPGSPLCNEKLVNWAKTYGWKEEATLSDYSPFGKLFNVFQDQINNLINRLVNLEIQVQALQNKSVPTQTIQQPQGTWRRCCSDKGTFTCNGNVQTKSCDTNQQEIFILTK